MSNLPTNTSSKRKQVHFFVLNKEEQKDNFSVFSVTEDGHAGTKRLFIGNVDGLKYWNQMTFMGSFNLVTLMW